jgi:hypothetical protein
MRAFITYWCGAGAYLQAVEGDSLEELAQKARQLYDEDEDLHDADFYTLKMIDRRPDKAPSIEVNTLQKRLAEFDEYDAPDAVEKLMREAQFFYQCARAIEKLSP